MYLEAITVCVNYSDFLSQTLPHNKDQFDNLIVITDTKDNETKELCETYGVKCLQTDIFYKNNCKFNKGAAINYGLSQLEKKDWVVHLDADIYLPPLTRSILENIPLESQKLYGVDRLMCSSYEDWSKYLNNRISPQKITPLPHYKVLHLDDVKWMYTDLNFFPIGIRHSDFNNVNSGYEPIGYFQLWNPSGSNVFNYPTEFNCCDLSDIFHCKRFEGKNRQLIPEVVVVHLDTEKENNGKNWNGRKTKLFKPSQNKNKENTNHEIKKINYN